MKKPKEKPSVLHYTNGGIRESLSSLKDHGLPKPRANKAEGHRQSLMCRSVELHCCIKGAILKLLILGHGELMGKAMHLWENTDIWEPIRKWTYCE